MTTQIRQIKMSVNESTQSSTFVKIPIESVGSIKMEDSFNDTVRYQPIINNNNRDVFFRLTRELNTLSDFNVQNLACEIIYSLYRIINNSNTTKPFINYLSKLHLTEQKDKTALLEWNFKNFRFGFTIEQDRSNSSYYHVAADHKLGKYRMDSEKIGSSSIDDIVAPIVDYVLANT